MNRQLAQVKEIFNKRFWHITRAMWTNALFFIIFDFLNVFLPIFICLISANLNKYGAYATMGIGYVTSFQLAYSQIGLSFAVFANYYLLKKQKHHSISESDTLIANTLLIAIIYGIVITPLYIGPAWLYTRFANAHLNTVDSLEPAYEYIYGSSGFVFLITISCVLILNFKTKNQSFWALGHVFFMFGMMMLFSSTLGLLTPLKASGLGLGLSLGTLLSIIVSGIHHLIASHPVRLKRNFANRSDLISVVRYTWRPVIIVLSIQVLKGVALLSLNYQIPYKLIDAVPLNFQMSRILWYNLLYLIPFVVFGFTDSLYFFFATNAELKHDRDAQYAFGFNFVLVGLISIVVIIGCTYLIQPLAGAYIKNQHHTYNENDPKILASIIQSTKTELIEKINNSSIFDSPTKRFLIGLLNDTKFGENLTAFASYLLKKYFVVFDAKAISDILIFPQSFAYFYVGIYCLFYPLGQMLTAARLSTRDQNPPALFMLVFQTLAIIFIVQFGIDWQENQRFWLMEAWSFPLAIIGAVAFTYMLSMYLLTLNHQQPTLKDKKLVT